MADFYDAEGIVSIHADSAYSNTNWTTDSSGVAFSLVSEQLEERTTGETSISFYIREPGRYAFWLLGHTSSEKTQPLQLRFLDGRDETISIHRLELLPEEVPRWVNLDQLTEDPVVLVAENEGFYRVQLESGGAGGLHVSKLHFSKDGSIIPSGAGFPETTDWRMEPEIEKRLQQSRIPPAWVFGVIVNQSVNPANNLLLDGDYTGGQFNFYTDFTSFEDLDSESSNSRSFDLYPAQNLLDSTHKNFPLPWYRPKESAGFEVLKKTIHFLSNPDLVTYESPWLLILPDWYDPQNEVEGEISEELMIRTLQLSAFQNVMFSPFQSKDQAVENREYYRRLIEFRRELFPYIYSYSNRARTIGTKLITGDRNYPDQFLFGDYFLVAPVFEEGAEIRELYLPEGIWYEYETGQFYEGGQGVEVNVSLFSIPLFVKAGAIIPKRPDATVPVGSEDNQELILDVYGGDSGTFRLYEDDGESLDYMTGEFSTIAYRYFEGDGYATFNIGARVNDFPGRRDQTEYTIRFKFVDEPVQITANGEVISNDEGWSYDADQRRLVLNWTQNDSERTEFRIEF
ncbi:DUF5110 domain-containing protein [Rhodohalobacter sp.]|uniref:glycoside hydrolase family 31 protein n=1 Tax=Rhodohalobacter sp. TaxID=1974210 RepID=UPI002ACD9922|nr:DUF5110 domain-containing protein [Rhodohalobacter sp.]MDZ7757903.1 glycoside hydrolase family 31 protein [Rhodohalobacter sp.]